ncbi:hypothetical protein [Pseudonocardia acaciae]|nr:hypothetical protein [Pseudonocardia acaciae]
MRVRHIRRVVTAVVIGTVVVLITACVGSAAAIEDELSAWSAG